MSRNYSGLTAADIDRIHRENLARIEAHRLAAELTEQDKLRATTRQKAIAKVYRRGLLFHVRRILTFWK